MVRGAHRSGSKRKVSYRTATGTKERYEDKKVGKAKSPAGKKLQAVASGTKSEIAKIAKTHRRPNRPFGGQLTSPEMRELLHERDHAGGEPYVEEHVEPSATGSPHSDQRTQS